MVGLWFRQGPSYVGWRGKRIRPFIVTSVRLRTRRLTWHDHDRMPLMRHRLGCPNFRWTRDREFPHRGVSRWIPILRADVHQHRFRTAAQTASITAACQIVTEVDIGIIHKDLLSAGVIVPAARFESSVQELAPGFRLRLVRLPRLGGGLCYRSTDTHRVS